MFISIEIWLKVNGCQGKKKTKQKNLPIFLNILTRFAKMFILMYRSSDLYQKGENMLKFEELFYCYITVSRMYHWIIGQMHVLTCKQHLKAVAAIYCWLLYSLTMCFILYDDRYRCNHLSFCCPLFHIFSCVEMADPATDRIIAN